MTISDISARNILSSHISLANPIVIQSTADHSKVEKEPLFLLSQTSADRFLAKLYERKIVDANGKLCLNLDDLPLPVEDVEDLVPLYQFLDQELCIEMGDKENFFKHLGHALKFNLIIDEKNLLVSDVNHNNAPLKVTIGKYTMPYKDAVQVLIDRGVLDSSGRLTVELANDSGADLPQMIGSRNALLWQFLNKQTITVQIGTTHYCSSYIKKLTLMRHVYSKMGNHIQSFRTVGGRARYRIKESPEYCKGAFRKLFNYLCQTNENIIPKDLFKPYEANFVADDDVRIEESNANKETLLSSTYNVTSFLASHFFGEKGDQFLDWVQQNAYSKYHCIYDGDQYSIASFKSDNFEFIFYASFLREQLFTDEIEEDITEIVQGKDQEKARAYFRSNLSHGWQPMICICGDIFHINNPQNVNIYGFPMMLSRLIRGKLIADRIGFDTLVEKTINLSSYANMTIPSPYADKGIAGRIAFLLKYGLEKHHQTHLNNGVIAYTITACNLLQHKLSAEGIRTLWECMIEAFSLNNCQSKSRLLAAAREIILKRQIPYSVFNALIQIAGFMRLGLCSGFDRNRELCIYIKEIDESPIIQFQMGKASDHLSIWCPLTINVALQTIADYIFNPNSIPQEIQSISTFLDVICQESVSEQQDEPVLARYQNKRHLNVEPLKQVGRKLLTSQSSFSQYFGWLLISALGGIEVNKSDTCLLVSNFWNLYKSQTALQTKSLFRMQMKYLLDKKSMGTGYSGSSTLDIFLANSKNQSHLQVWVEGLAETGEEEFCTISYNLWLGHFQVNASEITIEPSFKLYSLFIKHSYYHAYKLLTAVQKSPARFPFDMEMRAVCALLHSYTTALSRPSRLDIDIMSLVPIVSSFLSLKPPDNVTLHSKIKINFGDCFSRFIGQLKRQAMFDTCLNLLKGVYIQKIIISPQYSITKEWVQLCKAAFHDQAASAGISKAYEIWDTAVSMDLWLDDDLDDDFIICLISFVAHQDFQHNNWLRFEIVLNQIAKHLLDSTSVYKGIQEPIFNYLTQLIEKGHLQKTHEKIQYQLPKIFYKNYSIRIWVSLCQAYINSGQFPNAFAIWDKLSSWHLEDEFQDGLKQAAIQFILKLNTQLSDFHNWLILAKILTNKVIQILPPVQNLIALQECIEQGIKADWQVETTILYDLMEQFLRIYTKQPEQSHHELKLSYLLLLNFLKRADAQTYHFPSQLLELILISIPHILTSMQRLEKHLDLCNFVHQLHLHQIDFIFSDDAAAIADHALNHALDELGQDLVKIKEFIPVLATFIESLPHSFAAQNPQTTNLIKSLCELSDDKEAINIAFQLLDYHHASQASLWSKCFEGALLQNDHKMIKKGWHSFKRLENKYALQGTQRESALCWHKAVSCLAKINYLDFATIADAALNPTSPFYAIFSSNDNEDMKDEVWLQIIQYLLSKRKKTDIEKTRDNIVSLRKELREHRKWKSDLLPILASVDCEIVSNFSHTTDLLINNQQLYESALVLLKEPAKQIESSNKRIQSKLGLILELLLNYYNGKAEPELMNRAREILCHENTKAHLDKGVLSTLWGNYLNKMIESINKDSTAANHLSAAFCFLKHHYLTIDNPEADILCIDTALNYLVSTAQVLGPLDFMNFIDLFFVTLINNIVKPKDLPEDYKGRFPINFNNINCLEYCKFPEACNFFSLERISLTSSHDLPYFSVYLCPKDNVSTSQHSQVKTALIKYASLLFKKIMEVQYTEPLFLYLHKFIYFNIEHWLKHFPDCNKDIVMVLSQYTYWPLISDSECYNSHESCTLVLIGIAQKNKPGDITDSQLVEWSFYFKLLNDLSQTLRSPKYQDAAVRAIKQCAKQNTVQGIVRAVEIFEDMQTIYIYDLKQTIINDALSIILQYSYPFLFQIVKPELCLSGWICLQASIRGDARKLYSLFKLVYQCYKDPEFTYPQGTIESRSVLYLWLKSALTDTNTLMILSKADQVLFNTHLDMIEGLVTDVFSYLDLFSAKDHLAAVMVLFAQSIMMPVVYDHNSEIKKRQEAILTQFIDTLMSHKDRSILEAAKKVLQKIIDRKENVLLTSETLIFIQNASATVSLCLFEITPSSPNPPPIQ